MVDQENDEEGWGAYAAVLVRYDGSLEEMLSILVEELKLREYGIETHPCPPHEAFATFEGMGWDGNLCPVSDRPPYAFEVFIATVRCLKDDMDMLTPTRDHNLSWWLMEILRVHCGLDVIVSVSYRGKEDAGDTAFPTTD